MTTARHLARIGAVGAVLLLVFTLLHPVALSLRQIEIGLAGLSSILSGLTLVAPGFLDGEGMLVAEAGQAPTSFSGSTMALSMALSSVLLVLACLAAVLKRPLAASEGES